MLSDKDVSALPRIKAQDIFDGFSRNFHKDGLFSTEIFGKVGEERRNRLYGYIDLRLEILHPILFELVCELKSLYGEILAGKSYAIFNKDLGDFEKADAVTGKTGYNFFMSHITKLKLETREGYKREFNIKLFDKYRDSLTISKWVVMPAGLRDYEIDENGKPSEDEINGMYRKILAISNMVENIDISNNAEYLDSVRYNLQLKVGEVYNYIKIMLKGKKGFIQGKWASRKVYNSTRNVISSYIHNSKGLDDPTNPGVNQTIVGLYQFLRATLPLAINKVRTGFLSEVLIGPNSPAVLVNKDTLKKELVHISPDYFDSWMTYEGLEKIMAKFSQESLRHEYLMIDNKYYFGLTYKGPDGTYKLIHDKDELPDDRSVEHVTPLTLSELLYLSVCEGSDKIPTLVTRYPVAGLGSIYPSYCYLKSTIKSEVRYQLDSSWNKTDLIAREFPVYGEGFFNTVAPNSTKLARMAADFDRKQVVLTGIVLSDTVPRMGNYASALL